MVPFSSFFQQQKQTVAFYYQQYNQIGVQFIKIQNKKMKRLQLKKQKQNNEVRMTLQNLKICARNQQGYQTLYLNDSLQLQFYSFVNIQNLQHCVPPTQINNQAQRRKQNQNNEGQDLSKVIKGINTIYLNNNLLTKIQNLHHLKHTLITLNLSHNQIQIFQGLNQLQKLSVLDLSYNRINKIHSQQIKGLNNLKRLNLNSNRLKDKESIAPIVQIGQTLQTLQLANNQHFSPDQSLLTDVMKYMTGLRVLVLKQTPFARGTKSYRKQVILSIQSLTFLDQRPVTKDQRFLTLAWKRGGIVEQRQARKLLNQSKQQKNKKIMQQIQEKNKIINEKVQKIYLKKGQNQINQYNNLLDFTKSQDFQLIGSQQQSIIKLKIQQLERYLQLLKQSCRQLDLDKQLGLQTYQLPKMLIQKRTSDCIYIYNVSQHQLELIKNKYYPDQSLPLKAVNYEKPAQLQWLDQYNQYLLRNYRICKGNWELILPSFNLDIYEFDSQRVRNIKRWKKEQLVKMYAKIMSQRGQSNQDLNMSNGKQIYIKSNLSSNVLDCLD